MVRLRPSPTHAPARLWTKSDPVKHQGAIADPGTDTDADKFEALESKWVPQDQLTYLLKHSTGRNFAAMTLIQHIHKRHQYHTLNRLLAFILSGRLWLPRNRQRVS
jgi:hypothetical protein